MRAGDQLTLSIEKPAAGGRMIAWRDGAVVLVAGAIPGEVVEARVEKVQRGTVWADATRVLDRSPDRIDGDLQPGCGGNVFSHVRYERQLDLKRAIIADGFRRLGRLETPANFRIAASPIDGYRMRARLHVLDGRIGFFRDGTHRVCDPGPTRQLTQAAIAALNELQPALARSPHNVEAVEVAENRTGVQRALHLVCRDAALLSASRLPSSLSGVTGLSWGSRNAAERQVAHGAPTVSDTLELGQHGTVTLTRHVNAFFQGNRFLLQPLLEAVVAVVPVGRVLDLYAGVGLFAVALARRRDSSVVAIEGDEVAAADLAGNAQQVGASLEARWESVEAFLATTAAGAFESVIVDPPRTGMSKEAVHGLIAMQPSRIVYVSCDVATLSRDARRLVDAGYRISHLEAFDLFPNTAHVETLIVFEQ